MLHARPLPPGCCDAKRLHELQEELDEIMGTTPLQTVKQAVLVFVSRYPQGKWADDENQPLVPGRVRPNSSNEGFTEEETHNFIPHP